MKNQNISKTLQKGRVAASFFVPLNDLPKIKHTTNNIQRATILIPTFRPNSITYKLVKDILHFNPLMEIIVIDDNSPLDDKASAAIFTKIRELQKQHPRFITMLRTPNKFLKASALNYGLEHLATQKSKPSIVITVDDDVVVNNTTFTHLIDALYADKTIGAVCASARIKNKSTNLLTRLQSLEYHGFNITKVSDNGFLLGPLVMPGMLTAFRYEAMSKVGGFSADKLLEDYDITVRVKNAGYRTAIIAQSIAWTYAPETLKDLGKQRIRWSYGGLIVVKDFWRDTSSIFQDLIGHVLFISLFTLIVLSFVLSRQSESPAILVIGLIVLALLHFFFAFVFNVLSLLSYPERDKKDWLIKLSIFPEFAYSNLLSGILMGAYFFLAFNIVSHALVRMLPGLFTVQKMGLKGFSKIGYSTAWGTRA